MTMHMKMAGGAQRGEEDQTAASSSRVVSHESLAAACGPVILALGGLALPQRPPSALLSRRAKPGGVRAQDDTDLTKVPTKIGEDNKA